MDWPSFWFGMQVCMLAWIGTGWLEGKRDKVLAVIFWIALVLVSIRILGIVL